MVYRNIFGIVIPIENKDISIEAPNLSFSVIQKWVCDNLGKNVSKSSISQLKDKCGIIKLEYGCKASIIPQVKTENEKAILEAFEFFNII